MLIELVYCSVATRVMSADDLRDLLDVARRKNATLDVTGMLLYGDITREFVQLLEGEEDVIKQLMSVISADDRHTSLDVIYQGKAECRSFEEWSMAFRRLEDLDPELYDGCSTFVTDEIPASLRDGRKSRARSVMAALSSEL